jgi:DNA-binding transcriptional regulator YiaG
MTTHGYQYTESGLDNIYLANGYDFVDGPGGRQVKIKNVEGLHALIGRMLVDSKKNLTGKEIRFLRHEMLMSQATLAKLLEVSEQAVARWEKGKTGSVPKPAESLIRLLYREHTSTEGAPTIRVHLKRIAELENALDGQRVTLRKSNTGKAWRRDDPEVRTGT